MSSSPANCPTTLAVTSVSDYDGLPGGTGTPQGEPDLDDTATDFSNWGSNETAARTIAGPGKAGTCACKSECIFSTNHAASQVGSPSVISATWYSKRDTARHE